MAQYIAHSNDRADTHLQQNLSDRLGSLAVSRKIGFDADSDEQFQVNSGIRERRKKSRLTKRFVDRVSSRQTQPCPIDNRTSSLRTTRSTRRQVPVSRSSNRTPTFSSRLAYRSCRQNTRSDAESFPLETRVLFYFHICVLRI